MSDPRPEMSQANEACVGPQSEAAGKASSCQGCPNANICASGAAKGEDPDLEHIKQRMSQVKRKVMVLSGKGGVGKSTMTKELAMSLGRLETNVGIMDTDICGPSMPRMTGTRGDSVHRTNDGWEPMFVDDSVSLISIQPLLEGENDAVVFRGPRKNGLIKNFLKDVTWGDLDILLIDTPPGTSDEHLSIVQYLGDCGGYYGAIVVTTPQEVAVSDVRRELNFCKKRSIPVIGIIENMSGFVCPNCKGESEVFPAKKGEALSAGQRLAEEFAVPFLGKLPLDPALMASCEEGLSLPDFLTEKGFDPGQSTTVGAFKSLAGNLLKSLDIGGSMQIG